MQGTKYENETGAINEADCDNMGNIMEMRANATTDGSWKLAENSGETLRSMSNPNLYKQPAYVGDEYYGANVITPHQYMITEVCIRTIHYYRILHTGYIKME